MTPTFNGQSVFGTIATAGYFVGTAAQEDTLLGNSGGTTTIGPCASDGPAIAVTGTLSGSTTGNLNTAKASLSGLAGAVGTLVLPTGRSSNPGAYTPTTLTAAATQTLQTPTYASYGGVPTAPTALVVASVAGLAVGQAITVQSVTSPNADQAVITAIASLTLTVAPPLRHGYAVGDLVGPLAVLQPYQTLGSGANPPGWDTWPGYAFAATDLVFGSTTGSGPYTCTYSLVLRQAAGSADVD
jgi:hypothetical protein